MYNRNNTANLAHQAFGTGVLRTLNRSKCQFCNEICSSGAELDSHLRSRHSYTGTDIHVWEGGPMEHALKPQEENEPYICPHCQKTFSFLCHYKRHLVIHSKDRPHKCELCSSCFKRKDHLLDHVRRRHGKPFAPSSNT